MNTTELVVEIRPEKKIQARTGFEPMTSAISVQIEQISQQTPPFRRVWWCEKEDRWVNSQSNGKWWNS